MQYWLRISNLLTIVLKTKGVILILIASINFIYIYQLLVSESHKQDFFLQLAGLETCYFKYLFNTLKELKESMDGEVYEKSVKHLVIDIKREIAVSTSMINLFKSSDV